MPTNLGVPNALPVSIGTHQYQIAMDRMRRRTLPALRPQVDQALQPGEQTLNAEGSWIRSQTDWSMGARQEVLDDVEVSAARRFLKSSNLLASRGGRLELAGEVQERSTTFGDVKSAEGWDIIRNLIIAGSWAWWIDASDSDIKKADLSAGIYVNPAPATANAGTYVSLTSDGGDTIWAGLATTQLWRTEGATLGTNLSAWGAPVATAVDALFYVNGHLLAIDSATARSIYEVSSTPSLTLIYTHPSAVGLFWGGATSAPNGIYLWTVSIGSGGYAPGSTVYVIDDLVAGASLSAPRVACPNLPTGESILKMEYYGGIFVLVTYRITGGGVRIAVVNADGSLSYGPLLELHDPDTSNSKVIMDDIAIVGDSAYVTYRPLDITDARVARLDLSRFAGELQPAVFPHTFKTNTGSTAVFSRIVGGTPNDRDLWMFGSNASGVRIWATRADVSGGGVTRAGTGTLYTGWITYGIAEPKQLISVQLLHDTIPTGASIQVHYVEPDGTETSIGTTSAGTTATTLVVNTAVITPDREFQLKFTFTRGTTTTTSPVLRSWSCRAIPIPTRQEEILLPILLFREVETHNGTKIAQNPYDEYVYLKSLVDARTPVALVEGGVSSTVIVDAITFPPSERDERRTMWGPRDEATFWEGICEVRCVTVA